MDVCDGFVVFWEINALHHVHINLYHIIHNSLFLIIKCTDTPHAKSHHFFSTYIYLDKSFIYLDFSFKSVGLYSVCTLIVEFHVKLYNYSMLDIPPPRQAFLSSSNINFSRGSFT